MDSFLAAGASQTLSAPRAILPNDTSIWRNTLFTNLSPAIMDGISTSSAHHWLKWVVEHNMPLEEVDNPNTRAMVSINPIDSFRLEECLLLTACALVPVLSHVINLAGPYTLLIDEWKAGTCHYIGISAGYLDPDDPFTYKEALLRMQPFTLPQDLSEDSEIDPHAKMVFDAMDDYNLHIDMLQCIIAPNTPFNTVLAKNCGVPLVSCAVHRLKLGMEACLESLPELVSALDIVADSTQLPLHRRRSHTLPHHPTNWVHYIEPLHKFVHDSIHSDSTWSALSTVHKDQLTKAYLTTFPPMKGVASWLKSEFNNVTSLRNAFDECLCEEYSKDCLHLSILNHFVGPNSSSVACPDFENGLYKIIYGIDNMTLAEEIACSKLESKHFPFMHCFGCRYISVSDLIKGCSNSCDVLFTSNGYDLLPHYAKMKRTTLEGMMFLKKNLHHWDSDIVGNALCNDIGQVFDL